MLQSEASGSTNSARGRNGESGADSAKRLGPFGEGGRETKLKAFSNVRNFSGPPGDNKGVKKLVFKSFKVQPKVPEEYEREAWGKLRAAVLSIYSSTRVTESLEELYKACENLCLQKKASTVYTNLQAVCEEHVKKELESLRQVDHTGDLWLQALDDCWTSFCRQQMMIRSIFLYLDRTYVLQTAGMKNIWDLGLSLFRTHIMGDHILKSSTVTGILELIQRDRNGQIVSRDLLSSMIRMFLDLNIYANDFEMAFLARTELYYLDESDVLVNDFPSASDGWSAVGRYLHHIEKRIRQESDRCDAGTGYLAQSTRKPLVAVLERVLTLRHMKTCLEKGFDGLMTHNEVMDGIAEMRKSFAAYISIAGKAVVIDPSRDADMVPNLLALKTQIDTVVTDAFDVDADMIKTVKDSFETFINQRPNKPAEMIAKHIDVLLRASKGITEEEIENVLDKCLVLFRYINGKDVFEAFYKRDLAKRLLLGRSASVDMEKAMLVKLRSECGAGFTSKLEGMFRDMETSHDFMISFDQSPRVKENLGPIDLYVNVLTAGFWPTSPPAPLSIPQELARCQQVFMDFYSSKYSGRVISWQNKLGVCVLKASFRKGTKELSVSLFQATILLLFNASKRLTYTDILSSTNMDPVELDRTLQSLACGKVRVLVKIPKGKDVKKTDSFEFWEGFENPLYRIKINSIQMKETVEEQKETTEKVFADRQYQVDAAIVRIMKSRKKLSHQLLIAELFDQLKFPIKPQDLKKRIESLIDREYLERDPDDSGTYNYCA
ncbi:Cullin-domain-containing protein [Chytridium lagenaria]|nr:Cullin-domain-containing protein [Chytridium lagenaria]